MTLQALSGLGHDFSVPRFVVEIGGTTFEETDGIVSDVTVDATMDGADHFDLTFATRFDHEASEFLDFDWNDVPVGVHVEIAMGYGTPEDLPTMFIGSVRELGTSFPASGAPTISVSGYGTYHDMTKRVVQERWEDSTDDEIAAEIAAAYGLDAAVTPVGEDERRRVTYNNEESDADYLVELAERNTAGGRPYQVYVRADELRFGPPAVDAPSSLTLTYGESLESFSPTFTDARTLDGVKVHHWDPEQKAEIVGTAGDEDGDRVRTVKRPVTSQKEADRLAERLLTEREDASFEGSAETIGIPELDVDQTVSLRGLGERFSGRYYITDVVHTIDTSGYRTSFDVRLATEVER